MVYNIPHDFFFTLLQFILGLNVLDDELFDCNGTVFVDIDLVEDLVHDLVAHLVVQDLLQMKSKSPVKHTWLFTTIWRNDTYFDLDEILVKLRPRDDTVLISIDKGKLLDELLLHVVLQAGLLDALVDGVRVGEPVAYVYVHWVRRVRRRSARRNQHVDIRHCSGVLSALASNLNYKKCYYTSPSRGCYLREFR